MNTAEAIHAVKQGLAIRQSAVQMRDALATMLDDLEEPLKTKWQNVVGAIDSCVNSKLSIDRLIAPMEQPPQPSTPSPKRPTSRKSFVTGVC